MADGQHTTTAPRVDWDRLRAAALAATERLGWQYHRGTTLFALAQNRFRRDGALDDDEGDDDEHPPVAQRHPDRRQHARPRGPRRPGRSRSPRARRTASRASRSCSPAS